MPSTLSSAQRKKPPVVITGQADLLVEWRDTGKITPSQFNTFTRTSPKGS
ncbi:hypothetical protein ACFYY2_12075 [Streptomyces sp. NPDC001822]